MKRFITYLFTYENRIKGKNIGFIRTDQRDDTIDMEIHVQGMGRYQGPAQVYLIVKGDGLQGIPVGEFLLGQGRGTARIRIQKNSFGENAFDDAYIVGVGVRFGGQYYAASSWKDTIEDGFTTGAFQVWQPEQPSESPRPVTQPKPTPEPTPEPDVTEEAPTPQPAEEPMQQQSCVSKGTSPRQPRRIDLSDIRKLPKRNWYLCNNSFLIHGFFNYHYLIVWECDERGEKRTYLGVPGIYERPERMMALLFGFPDFRLETDVMDEKCPQHSPKEEPIGKFGYWLCPLEM